MLLFEFADQLYGYVVCHFGARFSAYWWQRLGALLLRLAHSLLAQQPHRAWLYVDDLLAALLRSSGELQLALKLADQIQALLSSKKVNKKALQSCLGLLNWATSISHHLRSYTAPLYSDLNSPRQALFTTSPRACGSDSFSAWTIEPWSPGPSQACALQTPHMSSRWAATKSEGSPTCPSCLLRQTHMGENSRSYSLRDSPHQGQQRVLGLAAVLRAIHPN